MEDDDSDIVIEEIKNACEIRDIQKLKNILANYDKENQVKDKWFIEFLILKIVAFHWVEALDILIKNGVDMIRLIDVNILDELRYLKYCRRCKNSEICYCYKLEDKIKFLDYLHQHEFRFDILNDRIDTSLIFKFIHSKEDLPIVNKLIEMGADPEIEIDKADNSIVNSIYCNLHFAIEYFAHKGYYIPSKKEIIDRDESHFQICVATFELIDKLHGTRSDVKPAKR